MSAVIQLTNLLEAMRVSAGCDYLSDLHDAARAEEVRRAVAAIPVERYPAEVWLGAARYITGASVDGGEAGAVYRALLAYLDKPEG